MKKTILILSSILILLGTSVFAGNIKSDPEPITEALGITYSIPNIADFSDIETYTRALDKADLHLYRLRSKSFILRFDSGLIVEIHSAEDLKTRGLLPNSPTEYPEKFGIERNDAVFHVAANDVILESRPFSIDKKTPK